MFVEEVLDVGIRNSHDSDDDFRSGCRNVGQCHQQQSLIHSDEGLTLETSVFESFTVANLPCG